MKSPLDLSGHGFFLVFAAPRLFGAIWLTVLASRIGRRGVVLARVLGAQVLLF